MRSNAACGKEHWLRFVNLRFSDCCDRNVIVHTIARPLDLTYGGLRPPPSAETYAVAATASPMNLPASAFDAR
jgi:hypothetical protein